jgi:hypothetical protein
MSVLMSRRVRRLRGLSKSRPMMMKMTSLVSPGRDITEYVGSGETVDVEAFWRLRR